MTVANTGDSVQITLHLHCKFAQETPVQGGTIHSNDTLMHTIAFGAERGQKQTIRGSPVGNILSMDLLLNWEKCFWFWSVRKRSELIEEEKNILGMQRSLDEDHQLPNQLNA